MNGYQKLFRDLKVPFRLIGDRRVEQTSVHTALREALASLLPTEVVRELEHRYGAVFSHLPEVSKLAMATVELAGHVTHERLCGMTDRHSRDVTVALASLVKKGLLESAGSHKLKRYFFPGRPPESIAGDSTQIEANLTSVAAPVAERPKATRDELRGVILRLCEGRFLTADQLATLVARTAANLQARHLRPMVKSGLLRARYPDAINRPDQAYTAVSG